MTNPTPNQAKPLTTAEREEMRKRLEQSPRYLIEYQGVEGNNAITDTSTDQWVSLEDCVAALMRLPALEAEIERLKEMVEKGDISQNENAKLRINVEELKDEIAALNYGLISQSASLTRGEQEIARLRTANEGLVEDLKYCHDFMKGAGTVSGWVNIPKHLRPAIDIARAAIERFGRNEG